MGGGYIYGRHCQYQHDVINDHKIGIVICETFFGFQIENHDTTR